MQLARENPFAVHRVLQVRYRLDDAGWTALLARLQATGWRGAIVGPHGSGKTTLLEDLAERLAARGWRMSLVRLSAERRRPAPEFWRTTVRGLGSRDAVLVDGAEQLGPWQAWALAQRTRRAGAFIVTSHRAGRLPTVHRCRTSPEVLLWVLEQLGQPIDPTLAHELLTRHAGNIREALRELYDRAGPARAALTCAGPAA